nr:DUF6090 family protein [uncultured Allomuricauda sp.]
MIKFFRSIRQRLLSENKFSKYLLYAIGEIVLVVIGILLALQINNWNEKDKNKVREQMYLKSLLDDMQNNLEEIKLDIKGNRTVISACDSLLLMAHEKSYQAIQDQNLERLVISLGNYAKLQLEQGTLEEIFYSGSLQTISNDSIRGFLVDWDRNFVAIKELEIYARDNQEKYLAYLNTFVPYYAFDFLEVKYSPETREKYFNNTELLNNVADIRFIARILNIEYMEKINEIEAFNTLVESEIIEE